ncbi:AAA family ATPase [Ectothiorhodospiraceae bacterium 2226]|nr:AAA family ATPase [Ectothiorhodospiraceae bacterium 2226]
MSEPEEWSPAAAQRLTTGVAGLDEILHGGLIEGSAYLVQGAPGTGKTILANQLCFSLARQGGQALYLTLLSETHDRLISHLADMSFYDRNAVSRGVYYASGFGAFEREGLAGILRLMRTESRARGATLLVLDGLFVLEDASVSEVAFRRFVYDVTIFAQLTGMTVLLLTNSRRGAGCPEYTLVDGWIELGADLKDLRTYRYLHVHKFRGSAFSEGRHMLTISQAGLRVLPRLESEHLPQTPEDARDPRERMRYATGIEGLDRMFGGGIPQYSTTLLVGPTGIGKTAFGLHFMSQCTTEDPGLIFSFFENAVELCEKAADFGIDLEPLLASGALSIRREPSIERLLDELAYDLLEEVRGRGVKRLFVEGVEAFHQAAVYPERLGRFLTELTTRLRAAGVTSMYTLEVPELMGGEQAIKVGPVSAVAHNIVLLRYVELQSETRRSIAIMKARESRFDAKIREYRLTDEGIRIESPFAHPEDVLTGHPHRRRGRE